MAENLIKVRPTLTEMEIGDQTAFPIEQMKSVRAQASELGRQNTFVGRLVR